MRKSTISSVKPQNNEQTHDEWQNERMKGREREIKGERGREFLSLFQMRSDVGLSYKRLLVKVRCHAVD